MKYLVLSKDNTILATITNLAVAKLHCDAISEAVRVVIGTTEGTVAYSKNWNMKFRAFGKEFDSKKEAFKHAEDICAFAQMTGGYIGCNPADCVTQSFGWIPVWEDFYTPESAQVGRLFKTLESAQQWVLDHNPGSRMLDNGKVLDGANHGVYSFNFIEVAQ